MAAFIPAEHREGKAMKLGDAALDKVTGMQGIITGHAVYLTGSPQFCLQPKIRPDGTIPDSKWFDEERIEIDPSVAQVLGFQTPIEHPGKCA